MNENVRRLSKDRILLYLALSIAAATIVNIIEFVSKTASTGLFDTAFIIRLLLYILQGSFTSVCLLGIRSEKGHRYASVLGGWYHFLYVAAFVILTIAVLFVLIGLADPLYALSSGQIEEETAAALRPCVFPLILLLLLLISMIVLSLLFDRSLRYTLCNLSARLGSPINTPEKQGRGPERILIAEWITTAIIVLAAILLANTILQAVAQYLDPASLSAINAFTVTADLLDLSMILWIAEQILMFVLLRRFRITCELDGTPEPPEENAGAGDPADGPASVEAPEAQPEQTGDRRE